MAIQLKWSNQNTPGNTLNIYRRVGETIDKDNKGSPIVALDSAATSYIDNTTEPGVSYAYLLEVVAPMGVAYSRPTTSANLRRVGPGGIDIITGDSEFGYMGMVEAYQLPDVWALLNFPEGKIAAYYRQIRWYKFVRKGKILFVPSIQMTTAYGDYDPWLGGIWVANQFGIASGLEWNFDISAAKYDPYRRQNIVQNGTDRFHLRAPRAYPDNWDGVYATSKSQVADTEVNQIIAAIYQGAIYGNTVGNVAPIVSDNLLYGPFICAEGLVPSRETLFKTISARLDNFAVYSEWVAGSAVNSQHNSGSADRILYRWRNLGAPTFIPVLQYIEE